MDSQVVHAPVPYLCLTEASACLVYMHVTELHICNCTILRFFVINTTLTCITQMIIWLCEECMYICTWRSKS